MAGLELVVGTYEQFTACYRAEQLDEVTIDISDGPKEALCGIVLYNFQDPSKLHLKEAFAAHLHTSSVRAIASSGKYVATGGADDRVCLLDIRDGTKENEFLHHDGTVNTVAFSHDGSYLLTGSNDGTMTAINTAKRTVDKTWKGAHKSAVLSISIHPLGKMALSLGGDMVLKTWDLITGRALFTTALHKNSKYGRSLTDVQWSPDGDHFALLGNKVVDVISIETTRSVRTLECDSKPSSMCWFSKDEIAVGLESGALLLANIHQDNQEEKLQIYESRLKAVSSLGDYIATASSAGDVSLWRLQDTDFSQICTQQIGCRPICLTLMNSGKYQLQQAMEEKEARNGRKKLLTDDAQAVNRTNTASITAQQVAQDLAWVSVETEDPVQLAAAKRARTKKRTTSKVPLDARRKVLAVRTAGNKRSNKFVEESTGDAVTPTTPSKGKQVQKKKGINSLSTLKKKQKTK